VRRAAATPTDGGAAAGLVTRLIAGYLIEGRQGLAAGAATATVA
jgi:hypothetical protein